MYIETLSALEEAIKSQNLLKKYNLDKIGVYGSFARGERTNDIDFFIDSDEHRVKDLIGLKKDIEKITEKKADIMIKRYANPIVLFRARKDMKYVTQ